MLARRWPRPAGPTGHVVGVVVGLDHVGDREAVRARPARGTRRRPTWGRPPRPARRRCPRSRRRRNRGRDAAPVENSTAEDYLPRAGEGRLREGRDGWRRRTCSGTRRSRTTRSRRWRRCAVRAARSRGRCRCRRGRARGRTRGRRSAGRSLATNGPRWYWEAAKCGSATPWLGPQPHHQARAVEPGLGRRAAPHVGHADLREAVQHHLVAQHGARVALVLLHGLAHPLRAASRASVRLADRVGGLADPHLRAERVHQRRRRRSMP